MYLTVTSCITALASILCFGLYLPQSDGLPGQNWVENLRNRPRFKPLQMIITAALKRGGGDLKLECLYWKNHTTPLSYKVLSYKQSTSLMICLDRRGKERKWRGVEYN